MAKKNGASRPEVSVLVPVYNVEEYLAPCLDSILQQPGVDLEVVCIDDCGTDGSQGILKEYQERDSRIRIVPHSENRGLSAARNTGIENAQGEYVVFLDSDDLLNPDKLQLQVEVIRHDQADMVYFHTELLWDRFPGDPSPSVCSNPPESVLFKQELHRTNLLNYPALLHATSSWSYIYSAEFLQRHNIRFDEHLKRWEDRAFWTRVARLADSVSIIPVSVRKYRQRSESITKATQNPEHLWMMLRQLNIVLDEFESFRKQHSKTATRLHTKYLHSYVAFRVTSWFLKAVNKVDDERIQRALLHGAAELFDRIEWPSVDLWSVRNYTRRLEIDAQRTALLCGLLRKRKLDQVVRFLTVGRLPSDELREAEDLFEGAYPISPKRFGEREPAAADAEGAMPNDHLSQPWMSEINVVIHIGFRKTGTTYIQRTFDLNREALLRDGVLFPDTGLDRTDARGGREGACAGHLEFIELVRKPRKRAALWREVAREIGTHKVGTILISAENFLHEYQTIDLRELRNTFAGFKQVTFIVSLRRPDRWMESLYKELVCGGWRGEARPFPSFLKEEWHQMDYANRLRPWLEEFGIDAVDAISVDFHKDEMDGVKAVLGVLRARTGIGPDPDGVSLWHKPSEAETYASPKAEVIEAIRILNAVKKPSASYRREIAWLIQKWNDADGLFDAPLMDPETQEWIHTEMYPGYVGLLQRFGLEDPLAGNESHSSTLSGEVAPTMPSKISSALMEDVVRVTRKLPSRDPVDDFFRRFNKKDFPRINAAPDDGAVKMSIRQRLVAALILKPILAVWNKASRDTKERLRERAKTAFGASWVDRIVQLARRSNPGPAAGK